MTWRTNDEKFRKTPGLMPGETMQRYKKECFTNADFGNDESSVTQTEICSWVDNMMHSLFIGRHYAKVNFCDIDIRWSFPGLLQTITAHPQKWLPLHKMCNRLDSSSRFAFWKMVFENRNSIPQNELLLVWYDCLADRGSLSYQRVSTYDGIEEYASNVEDSEMQKNSIITDPLLIDDPIVCFRYCQVQKPGWEKLQYIHGRRHQTLKLSDAMRQAIHEDNAPGFAMHLDMSRCNVSFSLLMEVLQNGAAGIFRYLLENNMLAKVITTSELCCFLTAWFQDSLSVPLLTILDELQPGLVKSVRDVFGRNLLWYAVQNMKTGWFHPDCRLTPFLLEHGCDPQNTNQIGLTWQMITDGLTEKHKEQMMRRRYNMENYKASKPYLLQLNQPLNRLKV